jgi:acetyl esterase/lipase
MDGFKAARNVTVPTLIPFLPDPAKATGAAVVVAPGGAYMMLTMDTEGIMVARKLAEHGVAAFVLKYRLDLTPRDIAGFNRALGARMDPILKGEKVAEVEQPLAVDDAAAALRLIRSRAAEWHIDPQRTGMVGFSAGARTALRLTLQNRSGARPSFVGVIYGPMLSVAVPDQAPPMFVALAADDPIWGHAGFGLVTSWQAAGRSVELHFYEHGNHGFGMRQTGTTSELWLDEFLLWMKDGKLLER